MAVVIETTIGDFTIDLYVEERPQTCKNFLKLCKIKYYNFCLFHSIQPNFLAQTGDPSGSGTGGESVFGIVYGENARYYEGEKMPKLKHTKPGLLSMVNCGNNMLGSQFFVTLGSELQSLDEHCIFAEITEGMDILLKLNETICDAQNRPYQDIRITHTVILHDPFEDLSGLVIPEASPEHNQQALDNGRIGADEEIDDTAGLTAVEVEEMKKEREAKARATILEIVGDLPDAEMAPPENVLFVCKLNPVTNDDDLEIIFSRFGKVKSCEVIRDQETGDSLQYAFVEFEDKKACEEAYFKMDNVLIDDRRIHVDFSQSVAKMRWRGKGRGVEYFEKENHKEKDRTRRPDDSRRLSKPDSTRNSKRREDDKKHVHREEYIDSTRQYRKKDDDSKKSDGMVDRRRRDMDNYEHNSRYSRMDRDEKRENKVDDNFRNRNHSQNNDERRFRQVDDRQPPYISIDPITGQPWKEPFRISDSMVNRKDYYQKRDSRDQRGKDRYERGEHNRFRDNVRSKSNSADSASFKERVSERRVEISDVEKYEKVRNGVQKSSRHGCNERVAKDPPSQTSSPQSTSKSKTEVTREETVSSSPGNFTQNSSGLIDQTLSSESPDAKEAKMKDKKSKRSQKIEEKKAKLKKKKKYSSSSNSNSSASSESSDSDSSSSDSDSSSPKRKAKVKTTIAKKYYHKGKLVKVVKKKKDSSSDSDSDDSSDSDRKKKKHKRKGHTRKIVKIIEKKRKRKHDSSDDTDSDSESSSSDESDDAKQKKKRKLEVKKKKRKRKECDSKKKKKVKQDSSSDEDNEEDKTPQKSKKSSIT